MTNPRKPLGGKSYGSIPHLPGSRLGPRDYSCSEGQERIATTTPRDKHDRVIVQEKLDGGNVGVARIDGDIVALSRAGYLAATSPFRQHHVFAAWVEANAARFLDILSDGERACGEWLYQAHGTRYDLPHEPFVLFDIMRGKLRLPFDAFTARVGDSFTVPHVVHIGDPIAVADALALLGERGHHGALEPVEGCVWRVERNKQFGRTGADREWVVDFLCKYVRHDKVDGKYLPEISGSPEVLNTVRGGAMWGGE